MFPRFISFVFLSQCADYINIYERTEAKAEKVNMWSGCLLLLLIFLTSLPSATQAGELVLPSILQVTRTLATLIHVFYHISRVVNNKYLMCFLCCSVLQVDFFNI